MRLLHAGPDQVYTTQTALHNCLEPHGCTAAWEGDELTLWDSTQSVFDVREQVAEKLELPEHHVRMIKQYVGGGFGSKQVAWKHTVIAALLSRQARRPVQLMLDREAENLAGGTDLLTLVKADVAAPAQLANIKRVSGLVGRIEETAQGLTLGALTTLAEIELNPAIEQRPPVLAEAAALAATPQLRNMATLGGNLLQRPRCWYFRNPRFHCWLKGGDECQARDGENQFHALFGGGPCYAVHPSDPAPALLALEAEVRLRGPAGDRTLPIADLFTLANGGTAHRDGRARR